jgi:hypothetical protein
MSTLTLETENGVSAFAPGAQAVVIAAWRLDKPAEYIELHLMWSTQGKGDSDASLVHSLRFDAPLPEDTKRLGIQLPDAPYSFSGKLVSLVWSLELVAHPSEESARLELVIAPAGKEILLHKHKTEEAASP